MLCFYFFVCTTSLSAIQLSDEMYEKAKKLNLDLSFLADSFADPFMTLTSDSLAIELDQNVIVSRGENKVASEFGTITTNQIRIDYKKLKVSLLGDVKLTHEDINLNSKEAYVKVNENTFIAKDAVNFSYGDYRSESSLAMFNRDQNQIQFEGNVLFTTLDEYAKGDVIIFDLTNETFLSKGKAKVKISRDVMP